MVAILMDQERTKTSYKLFGKRLLDIVVQNLPPGQTRNKPSAVHFMMNEERLGFDRSSIYGWFRGDIVEIKPLVEENFKRILLFYIGRPGLRTIEEIEDFALAGLPEYYDVLQSAEIQQAIAERKVVRLPPHEKLIVREEIRSHLTNLLETGGAYTSTIVIQGPPGIGKTLLLERLRDSAKVQAEFSEIYYASCDDQHPLQEWLTLWKKKLLPQVTIEQTPEIFIAEQLRQLKAGGRRLFLVDNVENTHDLTRLRQFCAAMGVLIVATRNLEVSRQVNYRAVIQVKPFLPEEAAEYYRKNYEPSPSNSDLANLAKLADLVGYNPLGLRIALRRVAEAGWNSVLLKLSCAPVLGPAEVTDDLFRPIWLAYESLSASRRRYFRMLAHLPGLKSFTEDFLQLYWGVSKVELYDLLHQFEKEAGILRRIEGEKGSEWVIHQQVQNYAKSLSNGRPKEFYLSRISRVRTAFRQDRPDHIIHVFDGVPFHIAMGAIGRMFRERRKFVRWPIWVMYLFRLLNPAYSTSWRILNQYSKNYTVEDFFWGYRMYLEGMIEVAILLIAILLEIFTGVIRYFEEHLPWVSLREDLISDVHSSLGFLLLSNVIIFALREFRRLFDWAQLWENGLSDQDTVTQP